MGDLYELPARNALIFFSAYSSNTLGYLFLINAIVIKHFKAGGRINCEYTNGKEIICQ